MNEETDPRPLLYTAIAAINGDICGEVAPQIRYQVELIGLRSKIGLIQPD